jgi:RNA polymerase sigma-70 factor (ECF subfamily)
VSNAQDGRQGEIFRQLFVETRTDLLAYLLRRAASPEEAADLLGEVYLIAWRKLDRIPDGLEARFWLYGVARNLLRQSASRIRSRQLLGERLAETLRTSDSAARSSNEDAGHGGLRRALALLSESDRELLTLSAWEGLSPQEIARVVGSSPNAVRVRLHRARARLREKLDVESDVPKVARRTTQELKEARPPVTPRMVTDGAP